MRINIVNSIIVSGEVEGMVWEFWLMIWEGRRRKVLCPWLALMNQSTGDLLDTTINNWFSGVSENSEVDWLIRGCKLSSEATYRAGEVWVRLDRLSTNRKIQDLMRIAFACLKLLVSLSVCFLTALLILLHKLYTFLNCSITKSFKLLKKILSPVGPW